MTASDTTPTLLTEDTPVTAGPGRHAWLVTGLLVLFMMVNFADKSVLGLAADQIRSDLHLTATQFGLANSAFFLLFSLSAIAVGLLADRVRPKYLLLIMAVLWSIAQTPAALGGGLAILIGSRVVLGAAEGPAFPIAQQAAFSWFPEHRRNLPGALVTLGVTLGVVLTAPSLTWVITHHGWRSALGVVAGGGVLWALAWALRGTEGPYRAPRASGISGASGASGSGGTQTAHGAQTLTTPAYRTIFRTRTWIGTTAAYFTSYWALALMLVWLPSYLHNALGYSTTAAGKLVALPWALGAVVLLGQAGVTARLTRRGSGSRTAHGRVGGAMLLLGATTCLATPLAHTTTAKLALLTVGFSVGGSFAGLAATTIAELAPPRRHGGALGAMNAVVTTAGLLAPAVTGRLVDAQGTSGYQSAILVSGALLLLGAIAALTLIDPDRDAPALRA